MSANDIPLFELDPGLDRAKASRAFAADGRVQIRGLLTDAAARTIHGVLSRETLWGLAWQAGASGPHALRQQEIERDKLAGIGPAVAAAMRGRDYAFVFGRYPMLTAFQQGWHEHDALDFLIEHINAEPMMDLVREVTGISDLAKADAQATLFGPNHFLALHDDSHMEEGWRVAYVMNFCLEEWRPDWGGYLNFFDEDGDIVAGFRPRFNALNLFRVPARHNVSYVPPFAPAGRFAITGWFRDGSGAAA